MKRRALGTLTLAVSVVLSACSGSKSSGCKGTSDCPPGFVCEPTGNCAKLCLVQSDCTGGQRCLNSKCSTPAPGTLPVIASVLGNDPSDNQRVRDGIVVMGETLANAAFEIRTDSGAQALDAASQSDTQVELKLPLDVRSGAYTLVATNAAGETQQPIVLQLPELSGDEILSRLNGASGTVSALRLPVGTGADQVAAGDHTHPELAQLTALSWIPVALDTFATGPDGWTVTIGGVPADAVVTSCGSFTTILGGAGELGSGAVASKVYGGLPPHTALRVTAKFHYIDSWDGERGWLHVDGQEIWSRSAYLYGRGGYNICGGTSPDRLGFAVDAVVAHTATTATLAFGSSLNEDPTNEAWGVSDVALFVSTHERGWQLVDAEDFEPPSTISGWTSTSATALAVTGCVGPHNSILGGYGVLGGPATTGGAPDILSKIFDLSSLPHAEVRISAEFWPVDTWDGENGLLRVNGLMSATAASAGGGAEIWRSSFLDRSPPSSMCGGASVDLDPVTIDAAIANSYPFLQVSFTSTLDQAPTDESWGIDNFKLWVR
jgi:hypothetical protein